MLTLSKETLKDLTTDQLEQANGASAQYTDATCVSCGYNHGSSW